MPEDERDQDILTLEPLLEAVREGIEAEGWSLSGLQKTTSHRFEGRWEGESTRSAYLFFHRDDLPAWTSIDVYLDETSRGLKGNLALVLDGPDLGDLGPVPDVVELLRRAGSRILPEQYRRPLTVRFRLRDAVRDTAEAETEYRLKVRVPDSAIEAGRAAVVGMARSTVLSFEELIEDADVGSVTLEG